MTEKCRRSYETSWLSWEEQEFLCQLWQFCFINVCPWWLSSLCLTVVQHFQPKQCHRTTLSLISTADVYKSIMMTKKSPVPHSALWPSADGDSNPMKYPPQEAIEIPFQGTKCVISWMKLIWSEDISKMSFWNPQKIVELFKKFLHACSIGGSSPTTMCAF